MIALIAAVARNGVIGADGRIPWDIPEDRAHFKELTMGHILVMGRRTYEEIGWPLPGRITIVVSRTLAAESGSAHALNAGDALSADAPHALNADTGLLFAPSLEDALRLAKEAAPEKTVFIAGGGMLYEAALPLADVLYLTEIDAEISGDTFFPDIKKAAPDEQLVAGALGQSLFIESEVTGSGVSADGLAYRYVTYRRMP